MALQVFGLLLLSALVAFVADYKLEMGRVPSWILGISIFGVGLFSMLKLRGAPREMGITFGLKVFSVTAYKILNFLLSMWLIRDLGFTDGEAGMVIMVWGLFMTTATVVSGSLTDVLGLRRTLFLGVGLCVLARLAMAVTTHKFLALAFGLFPLAIGEALCTPVLVAAMRLYSKPSQRTVAFSLFYGLMNFGFMFGYFISDAVTKKLPPGETVNIPLLQGAVSPFAVLILVSMLIDLLNRFGLGAIGQVDLEQRVHRNQSLQSLSLMAFQIVQVVARRRFDLVHGHLHEGMLIGHFLSLGSWGGDDGDFDIPLSGDLVQVGHGRDFKTLGQLSADLLRVDVEGRHDLQIPGLVSP